MTQKGIGHDVIPARSRLPHRHGSFHSVPVGGHFLGDDLCSPISMQHAPCGEAATGGAAMSSAVNQVGALLLTHDVSLDSTRVRITHDAQVDPAVGAAQVGEIHDPQPHASEHGGYEEPHTCHPAPRVPRPPPHPHAFAQACAHPLWDARLFHAS